MKTATLLFLLFLARPAAAADALAPRWLGSDGAALPFADDAEVLEFLREAEVLERQKIRRGINGSLKMRLRRGGVEAHAVFRSANRREPRHKTGGRVYLDFHDSYVYECAAYEVNRLLGLDIVPPCVRRDLGSRKGTMQLWIENAMTEDERRRAGGRAPSSIAWVRQQQTRFLFDALIYNFDRNQGNMLIDADWKLWLIDHTRSFHDSSRIEELDRIVWCERGLWGKLRALDHEALERRLGGLIAPSRIASVLERRDALVAHLEERIARLGEDIVLYQVPGARAAPVP